MLAKYREVFSIGWSNGFVYRLNFVMWRLRTVIQLLTVYFLWFAILEHQTTVFTYSSAVLFTYVLGSAILRAIVFSNQSMGIQEEISSGDLQNFLVKPISYFGYWFSRDAADKLLNILFSILEVSLLIFLLHPALVLPSSLLGFGLFLLSALLAMIMYFYFNLIVSLSVFWMPEGGGWPQRFLVFVLMDFLSGGLFPLDILPGPLYQLFVHLPTAYFIYLPLQIFLGRVAAPDLIVHLLTMVGWSIALLVMAKLLFNRGLKIFGAYGR